MSDMARLPDPRIVFDHLPKGSAVVLRHTEPNRLSHLAREIIPQAHARGLKVLISNDVRLAQRLGADGVHLSEAIAHKGQWRRTLSLRRPNFIITAAHHGARIPWASTYTGIDTTMISPVLVTASHPDVQPLGLLRFAKLVEASPACVIALGGITVKTIRRLKLCRVYGIAAIGAWCSPYS